jgi:hypothetical protein
MTMPSWLKKVLHALVPAAGAALAAVIPGLAIPVAAKVAIGGFVAYMLKPARPADPAPLLTDATK